MGRIKLAVLASTRATDMLTIIKAIKSKKISAEIIVLITNKECEAIDKAKRYKIPYHIITLKEKEREEFDREVSNVLEQYHAELILLIGYMRFLSKWFVEKYANRIMNVHPSLLPAFGGGMDKNVHQEVLNRGCKVSGCTVHFVDEGADTGPIIIQKCCKVDEGETVDSLKAKVQALEGKALVEAIELFSEGKIIIEGKKARIEK